MAAPRAYPDHYGILKVSPTATLQDIREAYLRLALQYHPDKNPRVSATAEFQVVSTISPALSFPDRFCFLPQVLPLLKNVGPQTMFPIAVV
jgi:hypothetical protein